MKISAKVKKLREITSDVVDKEKLLNMALNSPNLQGDWDDDKLTDLLKSLDDNKADLTLSGFTDAEINRLLKEEVAEDEIPEIKETTIQAGDIYQLGSHRLMCGDATNETDVIKLMHGQQADMVFTDPPYNIGINYNSYVDSKGETEYKNFCEKIMKMIFLYTNGTVFLTPGIWNIGIFYQIKRPDWVVAWVKMNGMSRTMFGGMNKWEPVLVWRPLKDGQIDVIQANTNRITELNDKHPTIKPMQLIEFLIQRSSKKGELVLDLFGGSGSTLIAAEQLGRKCYMMEIDPKYCQVIINRWQKWTGNQAVKLS